MASALGFLLRFAAAYGLFHVAYLFVPDDFLRDTLFHYGLTWPAAQIVDTLAPSHAVRAEANMLLSARASLEIVRGCEGAGVFFLLAAALIAFAGVGRTTLGSVIGGFALVYALNLARIAVLYFVVALRPAWFDFVHGYIAPLAILAATALFFWMWVANPREGAPAHATAAP